MIALAAMKTIKKAIIPVAGMGSRFLPATKAQPKEMLPIVDKPIIQYIVEEAVEAGIEQIIFITSGTKRAIEDHFDRSFELEYRLRKKGKDKELGEILDITDLAQFVYIRQRSPKGDGHAILQARELIGDEPCAIFFGDDLIDAPKPAIAQLMETYEKYQAPIVCVEEKPEEQLSRYGIVSGEEIDKKTVKVDTFVEKPAPGKAPSNLAVLARYIITPEIFEILANTKPGKDGELRLADALKQHAKDHDVYAKVLDGTWYDCGNKEEYLKAIVAYGLKHPEVNGSFKKYLSTIA